MTKASILFDFPPAWRAAGNPYMGNRYTSLSSVVP